MISYKMMRIIYLLILMTGLLPLSLHAEYEMHIPNCTQKGVENCGGFLFDNENGDVLFCGSEKCVDLKLPKSWRSKQKDKQSKQDQILEMLSNLQKGTVNIAPAVSDTDTAINKEEKAPKELKTENKKEDKKTSKTEKCDKEKKSLCKGSGGMQLGGTKMKLNKPKKSD